MSVEYDWANTSSYEDWRSSNYHGYNGNRVGVDGRASQFDSGRKKRVEFVTGTTSVIKPLSKHDTAVKHQREEMVTSRMVLSKNPLQRGQSSPIRDVNHETRREKRRDKSERKRSVSPQLRSRHVMDSIKPDHSQSHYELPHNDEIVKVKKGKFVKRKIDMSREENRKDSFIRNEPIWTLHFISYMLLIASGFYYTGQEDIVRCYACLIDVFDWKANDDVTERHLDASPNCPHLRKYYLKSIINEICPKKFLQFSDFANRYKSFTTWPIPREISGRRLAEMGFFYTGRDLQTQCYSCGCIKDDWTKGDDPTSVHISLCEQCPHILPKMYKVEYKTYTDRLNSFKNMPIDVPVSKEEFAHGGFVLRRSPCTVQCPECDLLLDTWNKGDNPMEIHYKLRNDCPFIRKEGESKIELRPISFPETIYCEHEDVTNKPKSAPTPKPRTKKQDKIDETPFHEISSEVRYPPNFKRSKSNSSSSSSHKSLPSQPSSDSEDIPHLQRSLSHQQSSFSDDDTVCIICLDKSKEYAIIPCGHWCVCRDCVEKITRCPVCRTRKENALRIYNP